jgi:hypothetical protein
LTQPANEGSPIEDVSSSKTASFHLFHAFNTSVRQDFGLVVRLEFGNEQRASRSASTVGDDGQVIDKVVNVLGGA